MALKNQLGDWPDEGRLAGIDYGTVRIGIAICDPSRTWTGPLETLQRSNEPIEREYFQRLVHRENITGWVIGLPIHCDGLESQKSSEARSFGDWLFHFTDRPVWYFDERFTSVMANRMLSAAELTNKKRKKKIDQVAAHLILENFLEWRRNGGGDLKGPESQALG